MTPHKGGEKIIGAIQDEHEGHQTWHRLNISTLLLFVLELISTS